MLQLVFLHGLESGPHGSKYQLLSTLSLGTVLAPDCEGVFDVSERLRLIEAALRGVPRVVLVGSSFGGLLALLYAAAHPARVAGMMLCAPAVHVPELIALPGLPAGAQLPTVPVQVLHGSQDDVVPLAPVQAYCAAQGFTLTVVPDGHRLAVSHAELAKLVREVWGAAQIAG